MSGRRNFNELKVAIDADPRRRARVDTYKRAAQDAVTLFELREHRHLRQVDVAATLGVSQANVSRVEREEDVYLSTLRNYVAALGGTLEIHAVFPDSDVYVWPASKSPATSPSKGGVITGSRTAGVKTGKAGSKVLRDGRTSKAAKVAAANAPSQRAPKRSSKKS